MQSLTEIRELLASHGLAPKKSLGQNFLIDHNLIRKLVDAAAVGPGALVLEVGHERPHFEAAFPQLQPVWLESSAGDDQVLLLAAEALK